MNYSSSKIIYDLLTVTVEVFLEGVLRFVDSHCRGFLEVVRVSLYMVSVPIHLSCKMTLFAFVKSVFSFNKDKECYQLFQDCNKYIIIKN